MSMLDTIPHSIDAEHAVIGAILLRSGAIDEVGALKPGHFYAEAHREIFRLMQAMASKGRQIDVITLAEAIDDAGLAEITGGLAYLGQMASNTAGSSNVRRYAEIVINKATERELLAAAEAIREAVGSVGTTKDKLNQAQQLVMAIHESQQQKQPRLIGEALDDYVSTLERRHGGEIRGMSTGFADIDRVLSGGLQDGNLVIVAGRPSMGKSAFTSCVALHVARDGNPAAILSMEMTEIEQIDRVVATIGRVPLADVLDANLAGDSGDRILAAVGQMRDLPLVIDDESGLSAHQVMSKARQIKRKHGLRLLIVDALGLMDYDANKAVSELGAITKAMKGFAKEMGIPVILLCQLSRKCEERTDKRPIMSDLRDSGNIEQDADVVLMLYRDEYYNPDTLDKGIAEVLIRKNRQGKLGVVPLTFIGDQTRFESFAGEWRRPEATDHRKRKGFGL
jgi:replicative DNA helicase